MIKRPHGLVVEAAIEPAREAVRPGHHDDPLLAARGARYGAFTENAAVSQDLKWVMQQTRQWDHLEPWMKEALEMVAHKIGRILCGDPYYDDSWVDIAGYVTRVVDELRKPMR